MPPKNHLSIDFAHDKPTVHQIDQTTLRLALTLTRLFYTEEAFKNLTDCAWDNFISIPERIPSVVIDLEEYVDEVLTWAFASCGRQGYDRVKVVCDQHLHGE